VSYQAAFPDHFASFEDVATLEDEVVPTDLRDEGSRPGVRGGGDNAASEAEAGSAAAASLLGGATLRALVTLHDRWVFSTLCTRIAV
jgi:hypothetical protein